MAACKFCGYWAGVASSQHPDCAAAAAAGRSTEEIRAIRYSNLQSGVADAPPPLQFKHIVWAIFLGMWLYTISAAIIYAVLRALFGSS